MAEIQIKSIRAPFFGARSVDPTKPHRKLWWLTDTTVRNRWLRCKLHEKRREVTSNIGHFDEAHWTCLLNYETNDIFQRRKWQHQMFVCKSCRCRRACKMQRVRIFLCVRHNFSYCVDYFANFYTLWVLWNKFDKWLRD